MNSPKNQKALETGSGIPWEEWLVVLDPHKQLDHTAMAKLVYQKIIARGKSKSPEWWAQGVTVAYEQHIGRRQVGQTNNGDFSVTVSKTIVGDMDAVLQKWLLRITNEVEINGVKISIPGKITQSEKWRYWRCGLANGSKVSVNIQTKSSGAASLLAINHDKLRDAAAVETWRKYWKSYSIE